MKQAKLVSIILIVGCFFGCRTSYDISSYEAFVNQLGDPDPKKAAEAFDYLLEAGKLALPAVLSESETNRRFRGSCDNPVGNEHAGIYFSVPLPDGALTEDMKYHPEAFPDDVRPFISPTVDDAKLFIAVSIGRKIGVPVEKQEPLPFFYDTCIMTRENEIPVNPLIVLEKLRDLYYSTPTPGADYSRAAIECILDDLGIDKTHSPIDK